MMSRCRGVAPLYERVLWVLVGDIADGSLPPETQLPSEDGLVARFKVSRTTVRKAIQNLVERGLVEVRRGKGTVVTQPKVRGTDRADRFCRRHAGFGTNPDRPVARQTRRGSRRSRRAPPRIGARDAGGQASACSLGQSCGDVLRRDIFAARARGKGCAGSTSRLRW